MRVGRKFALRYCFCLLFLFTVFVKLLSWKDVFLPLYSDVWPGSFWALTTALASFHIVFKRNLFLDIKMFSTTDIVPSFSFFSNLMLGKPFSEILPTTILSGDANISNACWIEALSNFISPSFSFLPWLFLACRISSATNSNLYPLSCSLASFWIFFCIFSF